MPKIFEVGGCVRDELMGVETNDIDFTFVLDNLDRTVEEGFQIMTDWLLHKEFTIFLSTPDCFTIRAKFPKDHFHSGLVADFVLARKEVGYVEGTRKPILELGTLDDDLVRRDFTLNAMAKDEHGNLIDLFGGLEDLKKGILRTPLDAKVTMLDDSLRLIRAFRFSITKGFEISPRIWETCLMDSVVEKLELVVSKERIREELLKMLKHDTIKSLELFSRIKLVNPKILDIMFGGDMWLKPTFEK